MSGFRYKKIVNFAHQGVVRVIKLMIPRSLGLAASQVNIIVVTAIASTLVSGSIAVFSLANNIAFLLLGLIALPFSKGLFSFLHRV